MDPNPDPDTEIAKALGVSPEQFEAALQHPTVEELYEGLKEGTVPADDVEAAVKLVTLGDGDAVSKEW